MELQGGGFQSRGQTGDRHLQQSTEFNQTQNLVPAQNRPSVPEVNTEAAKDQVHSTEVQSKPLHVVQMQIVEKTQFAMQSSSMISKSASTGYGTTRPTPQGFDVQAVIDSVSGFVTQALLESKANGASDEALAAQLAQGQAGIQAGIEQAIEDLKGMSLYNAEMEEAIHQVSQGLKQNIETLAERLNVGVEKPAQPEDPIHILPVPFELIVEDQPEVMQTANLEQESSRLLDMLTTDLPELNQQNPMTASANFQEQISYAQDRSFTFNLVTQEGDKVAIALSATDKMSASQTMSLVPGQSALSQSVQQESTTGLSFQIIGELNEQEQQAIQGLLDDMVDIGEAFFQGDMNEAVAQAQQMMSEKMDDSLVAYSADFSSQTEMASQSVREIETSLPKNQAGTFSQVQTSSPWQQSLQSLEDRLAQARADFDALFQEADKAVISLLSGLAALVDEQ